jgi:hypothetical protein
MLQNNGAAGKAAVGPFRIRAGNFLPHQSFNQKVEYICTLSNTRTMKEKDYSSTFLVPNSPQEVYDAITRVTDWWTINTDGDTKAIGDEFTVQFGDVHRTTQRITEAVLGKRIAWQVTASKLPWLKDSEEWKGTEIIFDIMSTPDGTRLIFTHIGLTPQVECFAQCEKGWDYFIGISLFQLLTKGAGVPDTTERTHLDRIGHVHAPNT